MWPLWWVGESGGEGHSFAAGVDGASEIIHLETVFFFLALCRTRWRRGVGAEMSASARRLDPTMPAADQYPLTVILVIVGLAAFI